VAAGAPTRADDGRIEIDQTCAIETGCGPSDDPGFPITLSPGSHVLTGNLQVSEPNTSAIFVVGARHVWIDLGGFTIQGPCAEPCTPGIGSGVEGFGGYATVRNGSIRGFALAGIDLRGDHSRIEDLLVSGNGFAGIRCDDGSLVRRVRAVRNAGRGITTHQPPASTGIAIVFADNLADRNAGHGIEAGEGSVVAGNLSDGNGGTGIEALVGGHAIHDNRVRRNAGNGIRASAGAVVEGNTAIENAGLGLFLNPAAGFGFNAIRSDPAVVGSATLNAGAQNLGGNLCNGATTCP